MSEPRTKAGPTTKAGRTHEAHLTRDHHFECPRCTAAILAIEDEASQPLREWWGRVIAVVPAKYRAEFDEQFRAALAQPQQPVLREALDRREAQIRAIVEAHFAVCLCPFDGTDPDCNLDLSGADLGRILAHPTSSPEDKEP